MVATESPAPPHSRRDAALDGLRTLAILLMISSHSTRLIAWDARREWSRFSLLIEPLTASLFLMLVGASLAHSWRGAQARRLGRGAWLRKQALRALALWAVSCLFYSLEDGFRLPDAVTMSGILATIAYAILFCSLLASRERPIPFLALAFAGLMALDVWMDRNGVRIFILNAGNSPLLPLLTFACLGSLGAFALEARRGGRILRAAMVTCALLALGIVLWRYSFHEVFSKPIGRYETARTFAIGTGDVIREKRIPYYNLRPILFPVIASLAVLLYAALALLRPWLERSSRFLFAMGRRSLDVYVLHLFLLALLVLRGGKRPLTEAWQGDAVFLAVTGVCFAWALGRDRISLRRHGFPKWTAMAALLFAGCIFDTAPVPDRPRARFDFARLDSLENPLAKWLPVDRSDNLVGVKFAFTTMDYRRQTDSNIAAFAIEAGGYPALAGAYFDISSRPANLAAFLAAVDANGAVPFVTLDPKDFDAPETVDQRTFMSLIQQGYFDDTLKALARVFRDFGKPAFFRFAHEMNGDWYPYSGKHIGGGRDADGNGRPDGPDLFIAAWRRVHGIFAGEGADKLAWVFCPNAESFPAAEWNAPFRYYPGNEYVDLVSADAYEYPDKALRGLDEVLEIFLNEMGLYIDAHGNEPGFALKPFGLSEFGTFRRTPADKAAWYDAAVRYIGGEGGDGGSRIKLNLLYNGRNIDKDFSIAGLGAWLRDAYGGARFRFRLADPASASGG